MFWCICFHFSSPELKAHIISQLLEQVRYDRNISRLRPWSLCGNYNVDDSETALHLFNMVLDVSEC